MFWKNYKILTYLDYALSVILLIVIGVNLAIVLLNQHTLALIGG